MDRKKLNKIRRELDGYRHSQPKASQLQRLARKLDRKDSNRGKHPIYVSEAFPSLQPLSIPNHKGRDLPEGTKHNILDQLEDQDIAEWEELLSKLEGTNGSRRNRY